MTESMLWIPKDAKVLVKFTVIEVLKDDCQSSSHPDNT